MKTCYAIVGVKRSAKASQKKEQNSRINDKLDLDIEYHNINKDIIQILKENNIEVNCWTCNDSEDGEKLVECGVDYITSNILE